MKNESDNYYYSLKVPLSDKPERSPAEQRWRAAWSASKSQLNLLTPQILPEKTVLTKYGFTQIPYTFVLIVLLIINVKG